MELTSWTLLKMVVAAIVVVIACVVVVGRAFCRTIQGPRESGWFTRTCWILQEKMNRVMSWFMKWWPVIVSVEIIIAAILLAIRFRHYWYIFLAIHLIINIASCSLLELEKSWKAHDFRWFFVQVLFYWPVMSILFTVRIVTFKGDYDEWAF